VQPPLAKANEVLGYSSTVSWFAKFDPTPAELRSVSANELAIMFPQGLVAGISRAGCALLERRRRLRVFYLIRGGKLR
jgi:hypothetical protein